MAFYDTVVRPLAFRFDPEWVHEVAMGLIRVGAFEAPRYESPRLEQTLFGVRFPNPLGLAAGFDKDAVALDQWRGLGFGFVEAGTITHLRQPGNPKPRLFRVPKEKGLINRMGFNNGGAHSAVPRFAAASAGIPVGVNLGKSKVTPLSKAPKDYQGSFGLLHRYGDYFVVNVSSPNTPGLRSLQEKGPLLEILAAMREVDPHRPLFVKVAPDLEPADLDDIVQVAHEARLTGLIATNTTIGRSTLTRDPGIEGGLSGRPVWELSNRLLAHLYRSCDRDLILMGVGGIFTGRDLFDKISLGAHLCQIYTGWVYGGPASIRRILREFDGLLVARGFANVAELRGTAT